MAIAVIPRVLTYSTIFASSFPIMKLKADDPLGIRFGLIVLACSFIIHGIAISILSYVKVNQKKQLSQSESVFGGLINLLSPCLIQHQTSGMIGICSAFAIAHFAILLTALSITIHLQPSLWNSKGNILRYPILS